MINLTDYLRQMTEFFKPPMCPIERFVLECGADYPGAKRPKGVRKRRDKMCFMNATNLALERGWRYVEGIADNGLISTHHAWCLDDAGNVVDPTWRNPENATYRGVVIARETLRRELIKNKVYGVFMPTHWTVNLDLMNELRANLEWEIA